MQRIDTYVQVIAVMLGILLMAGAAFAASPAECDTYATRAVQQLQQGQQQNCSGLNPPVWSGDRGMHYSWCLTVDSDTLRDELQRRDATLRGCGDNQSQAPRPALPPATAAGPSTQAPMDNAAITSTLYTLPVSPPERARDGAPGQFVCRILNVSAVERPVTIVALSNGSTVKQSSLRVRPRAHADLVVDRITSPVACAFTVEGPASGYRAGAVTLSPEGSWRMTTYAAN